MMTWITQLTLLLLPALLLGWLALFPTAGTLAFALQVLSIGLILFGLSLAVLWTAPPPSWVPFLYGLVILLIVTQQLITSHFSTHGQEQSFVTFLYNALGELRCFATSAPHRC
ncbi:hypothetical protein LG290_07965 [Halomonas sediminis]